MMEDSPISAPVPVLETKGEWLTRRAQALSDHLSGRVHYLWGGSGSEEVESILTGPLDELEEVLRALYYSRKRAEERPRSTVKVTVVEP